MADMDDLTPVPETTNVRWPEGFLTIAAINNSARELEAILAREYRDRRGGLTLSGGTTAYTIALNQDDDPPFDGLRISFTCNATCANDPTLNGFPLVISSGTPLISGDMRVGCVYEAVFLTNTWVMVGFDHNRRRDRLRLQPGNENLPTFEMFTNRDDAAETIGRWQMVARNKLTPTPANITYVNIFGAIVSPTVGQEQGAFQVDLKGGAVDVRALEVRPDQVSLAGATLQGPSTLALPPGFRILVGTNDLLAGIVPKNIIRFAENGTYARPANLLGAMVIVVGGGGSGARDPQSNETGGGGGGGGIAISCLPVTSIPSPITVIVGAGGVAPSPSGVGNAGGNSQFLDLVGGGGEGGTLTSTGNPGAGGTGAGGQLNMDGASGTPGGLSAAFRAAGAPPFFNAGAGGHGASFNSNEGAGPGQAGAVFIVEY